jgi:hypothetical protein
MGGATSDAPLHQAFEQEVVPSLHPPTAGSSPWVLRVHRDLTDWPGRYLVIVDSATAARPAWAARRHVRWKLARRVPSVPPGMRATPPTDCSHRARRSAPW